MAIDLDSRVREGRILLAAPIGLDEIEEHFANDIEREDVVEWEPTTQAVVSRRRSRLGALALREAPLLQPDPVRVMNALNARIKEEGLDALPWSDSARHLRARLAFLHRLDSRWPDVSDDALLGGLDEWLAPNIGGVRKAEELARLNLEQILASLLTWEQRAALDEWAPGHIQVPSGSQIRVDYSDPTAPVLAVRLQELFGLGDTPRVGPGRIPVTLHLLSPAGRPVQVTRDLAGFWRNTYFEVRKDLKGRYPKHHWPDDPLGAEPTRLSRGRARGT